MSAFLHPVTFTGKWILMRECILFLTLCATSDSAPGPILLFGSENDNTGKKHYSLLASDYNFVVVLSGLITTLHAIGIIHLSLNNVEAMMEAFNEVARIYCGAGLNPSPLDVLDFLHAINFSFPAYAPAA